jgi:hypothetical protein
VLRGLQGEPTAAAAAAAAAVMILLLALAESGEPRQCQQQTPMREPSRAGHSAEVAAASRSAGGSCLSGASPVAQFRGLTAETDEGEPESVLRSAAGWWAAWVGVPGAVAVAERTHRPTAVTVLCAGQLTAGAAAVIHNRLLAGWLNSG